MYDEIIRKLLNPDYEEDFDQLCIPTSHKYRIEEFKGLLVEKCLRCGKKRLLEYREYVKE